MKIQNFFLFCLAAIILIEAWKKLLPNYMFVNTNCIFGEITVGQTKKKVIDCIACSSFPIQVAQRGEIQVQNGNIQQLKQHNTNGQSQFHLLMFMQQGCRQYQCYDFQSAQTWNNKHLLESNGFHPVKQINKAVSDDLWEFTMEYDNRLSQDSHTDSVKNRFVNYILSPILPYSFLPAQQFYSSLIIKLRYTLPIDIAVENITKPVIKLSIISQSVSDVLVLSVLIFFTLAIKRHVFSSKNKIDLLTLTLSLGFLSPYLFSIVSFVYLATKTPHHVISLFLFVASLCLDMHLLAICGVALSSVIQLMKSSKMMSIQQVALFNLLVVVASIFNITSVLSSSPNLFCAFCQDLTLDYSKIEQKQKSKIPIDLQKIQQAIFQQH